jgi:hypothetical protein
VFILEVRAWVDGVIFFWLIFLIIPPPFIVIVIVIIIITIIITIITTITTIVFVESVRVLFWVEGIAILLTALETTSMSLIVETSEGIIKLIMLNTS